MIRFLPTRARLALSGLAAGTLLLLGSLPAHATTAEKTLLVADTSGVAFHVDHNLVNAWGISHSATSPFWISDNHTGVSTLYDTNGNPLSLVVTIPPPMGSPSGTVSSPTGNQFYGGSAFLVTGRNGSGPSRFIFVTEDGTISGWNPSADQTHAILTVDKSESGAIYKGFDLASMNGRTYLYAANFHAGTVDVFDDTWHQVSTAGGFTDSQIPAGFAPFNIANIGGNLYVTYAKQDEDAEDDAAGPGNGFIDVFNTQGVLLKRLVQHTGLNSPWGITVAPSGFNGIAGDLLVGNFGDGHISIYTPAGVFLGYVQSFGRAVPLVIDGLWGLIPGNGANGGKANVVYFTAGPDDESHGQFGSLQA